MNWWEGRYRNDPDKWTRTHIGHMQKKQRFCKWSAAVGYNVNMMFRNKRITVVYVRKWYE